MELELLAALVLALPLILAARASQLRSRVIPLPVRAHRSR